MLDRLLGAAFLMAGGVVREVGRLLHIPGGTASRLLAGLVRQPTAQTMQNIQTGLAALPSAQAEQLYLTAGLLQSNPFADLPRVTVSDLVTRYFFDPEILQARLDSARAELRFTGERPEEYAVHGRYPSAQTFADVDGFFAEFEPGEEGEVPF